MTIYTGDRDGAGTSAVVSVTLCGENGTSGPHVVDGTFERNGETQFQIEAIELGSIKKIRIGHDNSGIGPGWFLEKVKIQQMDDETKVWYCLCGHWLASDEEDGAIQRELPAGAEDGTASLPIVDYTVKVVTGDRRGAGTNANVFIEIFGKNGSSGSRTLDNASDNFERNKTDVFGISCVDLGEIDRIVIGHDNSGFAPGWFLDKVIIHAGDGSTKFFHCGRWFASSEDDGLVVRELLPSADDKENYPKLIDYRVTVITGDRRGAGTDANVFIQLYGENGSCPETFLDSPNNNFERNKTDVFSIQSPDLGKLSKIRIGHDNSGWGSAWFMDKVIIESESSAFGPKKFYFLAGKWFSTSEDDKMIVREIAASDESGNTYEPVVRYKIEVQTGDRRGAGTNANVFICITGTKGDTGNVPLDNNKNNFERNQNDVFGIDAIDLGEITKIRIGHDNAGFFAGWFLEYVKVINTTNNKTYNFPCGRWLDTKEDDGQIVREIAASNAEGKKSLPELDYEITVVTGDRRGAGTDANVFIELFGENGTTGKRKLEGQANNFERSQTDKFSLSAVELGNLKSINICHDNSGFGSGWFLEKVVVRNPKNGKEWYFLCGRWLATDEDDGLISRQLTPSNSDGKASLPLVDYRITVFTGDRRGAGTDSNVFIKLFGSTGKSGIQYLAPDDNNLFRRSKKSLFNVQIPDIGVIQSITIGHDDAGFGAAWYLEKVVIRNEQTGIENYFLCGKWLASNVGDSQIVRTISSAMADGNPSKPIVDYVVTVMTGDRLGAGTDANVSIVIYGQDGDTGPVVLDSSGNNFERNQTDVFGVQVPDLGELLKIRIGHDDSGFGSAWFLDKVLIENPISKKKWYFLCGKWFDKSEGDRLISREIVASNKDGVACLPLITYSVQVVTGDIRGAGTDANVFITIEGDKGDTGKTALVGGKNSFERKGVDMFGVKAVDIGNVTRITIGHDGKGWFSAWYLERVKVRNEKTGAEYNFQCGSWLDDKSPDGQISATLLPTAGNVVPAASTTTWKVTTLTGDVRNAGCAANVFIFIVDKANKDTGKLALAGDKESFERGKKDKFFVESQTIGPVAKIRIGHDGGGSNWTLGYGAAWYLATVKVKNMTTNQKFIFNYNEWIQKKNLVVELAPAVV